MSTLLRRSARTTAAVAGLAAVGAALAGPAVAAESPTAPAAPGADAHAGTPEAGTPQAGTLAGLLPQAPAGSAELPPQFAFEAPSVPASSPTASAPDEEAADQAPELVGLPDAGSLPAPQKPDAQVNTIRPDSVAPALAALDTTRVMDSGVA